MDLFLATFSVLYIGTNLHAWDLDLRTEQAEILISKTVGTAETAVVGFEKVFLQRMVALFLVG